MKKSLQIFLRIVFSRTMVTIVLLGIQIFWLSAGFKWLGEYSDILMVLVSFLSAALVVYIVNKDETPEFKLAWMIPICAAPVFGALLYLFVVSNIGHIGLKREVAQRLSETAELMKTDETVMEKVIKEDKHMAGICRYAEKVGSFPAYEASDITYFPLGESKYDDLLKELESAKEFIFLEYFIIERGKMWDSILEILKRKVQEGVEVRVMYDGTCCLLRLPYSYPKQLRSYGIKVKTFAPIRPLLTTSQNNRDHRKIIVIDGKTAYTGGINLSDEYINEIELFGHWKDVAIKIKGEAVKSFTMMFLQLWNVEEQKKENYSQYIRPEQLNGKQEKQGYILPYGDCPTIEENLAEMIYMDIINQATEYVHITTPYFIVDNAMLDALQYAARRGVDVKIVLPHIPDKKPIFAMSRTYYPDLLAAGVKVYEYTPGFMHAKVFTSDDEKAVVGTINMDYRSLYHHFECAAYIYRNPVVKEIEEDFAKTLEQCIEVDMKYYKQISLFGRLMGRVLRLVGPLM